MVLQDAYRRCGPAVGADGRGRVQDVCRRAGIMRYLGLTGDDRAAMLSEIGVASIDDLYRDVPKSAQLETLIDLPLHRGEIEVERAIAALAARNTPPGSGACFLGAGAY